MMRYNPEWHIVGSNDMFQQVVRIEEDCFDHPWSEKHFLRELRDHRTLLAVACIHSECSVQVSRVAGYVVFRLFRRDGITVSDYEILNIAVDPLFRRKGIGTFLVDRLKRRISNCPDVRRLLQTTVDESNLGAAHFFAANGFESELLRDPHEIEDYVQFRWYSSQSMNRLALYGRRSQ